LQSLFPKNSLRHIIHKPKNTILENQENWFYWMGYGTSKIVIILQMLQWIYLGHCSHIPVFHMLH